jgi:hypothetical protein
MSTNKNKHIVARLSMIGLMLVAILAMLMIFRLNASDAFNNNKFIDFFALHDGVFTPGPLPGSPDGSVLLTVFESATGSAEGFGYFEFVSSLKQNMARVPSWCTSGKGNTGVGGSAVMIFEDGLMRLKRVSGQACVDPVFPPIVVKQEQWVVVDGGTGSYSKATGKLTREVIGCLIDFSFENATFRGTIRLN